MWHARPEGREFDVNGEPTTLMHTPCPICRVFFNSRKSLNLHLSLKSRCVRILNKKVYEAKSKKQSRIDVEVPEDTLEDNPPEGWEGPLDEQTQLDVDEASRHFRMPNMSHENQQHDGDHRARKQIKLENEPDMKLFRKKFPRPAGSSFGVAETTFEKLQHTQGEGQMHPLGPFENRDEWELAEWLIKSGVSQTEMDKFLKLNIVRTSLLN